MHSLIRRCQGALAALRGVERGVSALPRTGSTRGCLPYRRRRRAGRSGQSAHPQLINGRAFARRAIQCATTGFDRFEWGHVPSVRGTPSLPGYGGPLPMDRRHRCTPGRQRSLRASRTEDARRAEGSVDSRRAKRSSGGRPDPLRRIATSEARLAGAVISPSSRASSASNDERHGWDPRPGERYPLGPLRWGKTIWRSARSRPSGRRFYYGTAERCRRLLRTHGSMVTTVGPRSASSHDQRRGVPRTCFEEWLETGSLHHDTLAPAVFLYSHPDPHFARGHPPVSGDETRGGSTVIRASRGRLSPRSVQEQETASDHALPSSARRPSREKGNANLTFDRMVDIPRCGFGIIGTRFRQLLRVQRASSARVGVGIDPD